MYFNKLIGIIIALNCGLVASEKTVDDDYVKGLIETCVVKKFNGDECESNSLYVHFENETFNYTNVAHLSRYTLWLRLMSNLEYYKKIANSIVDDDDDDDEPSRLMRIMAIHNRNIAALDSKISKDMHKVSYQMFYWICDNWIRYYDEKVEKFQKTFYTLQMIMNTFVIWNNLDVYHFNLALYTYRILRGRFEGKVREEIDKSAIDLAHVAFNYDLFMVTKTEIMENFYINYVAYVSDKNDRAQFNGMYVNIDKNKLLKRNTRFTVGPYRVHMHHNVKDKKIVSQMETEARFVYSNFLSFFKHINITLGKPTKSLIHVFAFDNKPMYRKYGHLWNIDINNGGITIVNDNYNRLESHVYFEPATPDLPRNYGHELNHAFYMSIENIMAMPSWYIEGMANRLGNRVCYYEDHVQLKSFEHITIKKILSASYRSNFLYPMGSALFAFLYELRPELLHAMIESGTYTFNSTYELDRDFDFFKKNKIAQCDHYYRKLSAGPPEELTQSRYLAILKNVSETTNIFNEWCKNYIQFTFEDVVYIITPDKVVKKNIDLAEKPINALEQITYNNNEITRSDFDWFLRGVIKKALRFMIDDIDTDDVVKNIVADFFTTDDYYSYKVNVSCQHNSVVGVKHAVVLLAYYSGLWKTVPTVGSLNIEQTTNLLITYAATVASCKHYLSPSVGVSGRFDINAIAAAHLDDDVIINFRDVRNNSVLHLAALYNHSLYHSLKKRSDVELTAVNLDNRTALDLYEYSIKYLNKYGVSQIKYCFTYIDGDVNDIFVVETNTPIVQDVTPTTAALSTTAATTKITISYKASTSTLIDDSTNRSITTTMSPLPSTSLPTLSPAAEKDQIKIMIQHLLFVIILLSILVCTNTLFIRCYTKKFAKKYVNYKIKSKSDLNNNNNNNKQKYNDDSTIQLFE
ncbi:peptidase MA superfamily [Malacosoma neustria nucleopolyhedrovirus]|uniref:peptidase MA superfamily n=1 Tax=Malacosoma neustria nuclear polyhedrosis virus TaxID=38012 RepID=UPI000E35EEA4|nr:peptidase MA superfamily [Malacosoma neustria nucleopolyhedrovirus]AUF81651.1 peptidase MA superfamily [Malacosoma neustria nucleopolyhedrovirus]